MRDTTTWVGLLRGINVGGHRRVPMADLRALVTGLGHQRVRTHKQSGNIVFDSDAPAPDRNDLRAQLETHIERRFGFEVTVVVHGAAGFAAIAADNPYPGGADPTKVGTVFLAERPAPAVAAAFAAPDGNDDRCRVDDDAVHLWCPSGFGRTKLTNSFFEKGLGVPATTRNWATLQSVIELTGTD